MTATDEQMAVVNDAALRLSELRKVASTLWPNRDDPEVLSELVTLMGQIRQAEAALR